LILVGVALDTVGQLEAKLIMHHYEGFSKEGRVKGRWFNVGPLDDDVMWHGRSRPCICD